MSTVLETFKILAFHLSNAFSCCQLFFFTPLSVCHFVFKSTPLVYMMVFHQSVSLSFFFTLFSPYFFISLKTTHTHTYHKTRLNLVFISQFQLEFSSSKLDSFARDVSNQDQQQQNLR